MLVFILNYYQTKQAVQVSDIKIKTSTTLKEGKTILEVMYESGFNSKSVFNTAFKQKTGMTPLEFRRSYAVTSLTREDMLTNYDDLPPSVEKESR